MADELRANYPGSATLYAIVRRISDAYVWNGSTFVVWADGDIASYDVSLTSNGGDYYTANFPTSIAAGAYSVLYYLQDGGTPAITDLLLPGGHDLYWNGESASDESEVAISAYALTTLAAAKTHIGISGSTYDTLLTRLINGVSEQIEHITGMAFKARDWRERFDGQWQRRLVLRHRPVQQVTKAVYGNNIALSVIYSGSAIDATATVYDDPESPKGGGLRLTSMSAAGTETANNLSFVTYPTVSTLATAVNLISGWTATVTRDVRSIELHPTGGEDAKSRAVTLYYPDQRMSILRTNYNVGTVEFFDRAPGWWYPISNDGKRVFPPAFQGVTVIYRAGYETIPADVQLLANNLVKEEWYLRTQNTALASYSLGVYSVSFAADRQASIRAQLAEHMDASAFVAGVN